MGQTTPGFDDVISTLLPWSSYVTESDYDSLWTIYGYNFTNFSFLRDNDAENLINSNSNNIQNNLIFHTNDAADVGALNKISHNSGGGGDHNHPHHHYPGDHGGEEEDNTVVNLGRSLSGIPLEHYAAFNGSRSILANGSLGALHGLSLWKGIPLGIVLVFLCLLTTVGNVMVLHAVRTERRLQTVSNLFIVSLAVADVIVGIVVMPISAFYIFTDTWMLGVAVCQIWIAVDYTASTASIFNLFILSLDRYWSVRQPLQYLHKRTKKRALTFIGVVWVASSLWIFPIVSWNHIAHGGRRTVPSDVCDTEYAKNMPFKLVTAFFNFYLPLSIMYILYFKVFIEIRKRSQFEMGQRNAGGTTTVFSYKSNLNHSASIEFSDCHHHNDAAGQIHVNRRIASSLRIRENGSSRIIHGGCKNARLLSMKKIGGGSNGSGGGIASVSGASSGGAPSTSNSSLRESKSSRSCKVEYVYDENVIDPQTEKIERYFYEEHYPIPPPSIPRIIRTENNIVEKPFPSSSPFHLSPSFIENSHATSHSQQQQLNQQYQSQKSMMLSTPIPSIPTYHHLAEPPNTHHHNIALQINSTSKPISSTAKRRFFKRKGKSLFSLSNPSSCPSSNLNSVHVSKKCTGQISKHKHETSFSPPVFSDIAEASSSSSASTFEEKRSSDEKDLNSISSCAKQRKPRESFSITSGIRKMRNGESLLERTAGSSINHSNSTTETGSSSRIGQDPEENSSRHQHLGMSRGRSSSGGGNSSFVLMGMKNRSKSKRTTSSSFLKKEIKAARQLGVIMGAFTLCFLPYFILFMVVSICDNCVDPGLLTAATWVGYLNSTLNPFLYPLCNANFRIKFKKMFRCSKTPQPSSAFPHTQFSRHDVADRVHGISSRYD